MLGLVGCLIINMHIRPLYVRQGLKFDLELLRDIVCHAERSRRGHDDVNFDDYSLFITLAD